jgi:hypothetical protein
MTLRYLQTTAPTPPSRSLRFHAEIVKLLRGDVPCSSAFSCVGKADALAYAYIRGDEIDPHVVWSRLPRLSEARATRHAVGTADDLARCAIRGSGSPFARDAWHTGDGRAIAVVLEWRGELLGVAGLARAPREVPFSADEARDIQSQAGAAGIAARFHVVRELVDCEIAAFDALGSARGLLLMIDRAHHQIFWAHRHGGRVDWASDVEPIAAPLLSAIERVPTYGYARVSFDLPLVGREVHGAAIAPKYPRFDDCVAVRIAET